MELLLLRLILIVGFCAATLGAAGFADPVEPAAPWMLGLGMVAVLGAGFVLRRRMHEAAHAAESGGFNLPSLISQIDAVARRTETLASEAEDLDREALCGSVNELLHGPCFEIGSANETWMRALGNRDYVAVWDGFAVGERLLARVWSLGTDGYVEEARKELRSAARHLRRSVDEGSAAVI